MKNTASETPEIVKDFLRYRKLAKTGKSDATRRLNARLANIALSSMTAKGADIAVRLLAQEGLIK